MEDDVARERLLALRAEATAQLADLGASRDGVVAAAAGANHDDEHDPEGTTIAFERELLQALIVQSRSRIDEVDAALRRLADGEYGVCASCGGPVGTARLEVRPVATHCVRHA